MRRSRQCHALINETIGSQSIRKDEKDKGWQGDGQELANLAPVAPLLYLKDDSRYPLHLSSHPRLWGASARLSHMDEEGMIICHINHMRYSEYITQSRVDYRNHPCICERDRLGKMGHSCIGHPL